MLAPLLRPFFPSPRGHPPPFHERTPAPAAGPRTHRFVVVLYSVLYSLRFTPRFPHALSDDTSLHFPPQSSISSHIRTPHLLLLLLLLLLTFSIAPPPTHILLRIRIHIRIHISSSFLCSPFTYSRTHLTPLTHPPTSAPRPAAVRCPPPPSVCTTNRPAPPRRACVPPAAPPIPPSSIITS